MIKYKYLKSKILSSKLMLPLVIVVILLCWLYLSNNSSIKLTIMHTNNLEGQITEIVTSNGDTSSVEAGFARLLTIFENVRNSKENVLILDAGDTIQSNILTRVFGVETYGKLMSILGYDAVTIGEHDFDEGSVGLKRYINSSNFPFLAANLDVSSSNELKGLIKPYEIIEKKGIKIAIIGLTNPESDTISKRGKDVKILDSIDSCKKYVKLLRNQANVIIVLSHLGIVLDRDLASKVAGINIIIGSHTRTKLVEPLLVKNPEKQKTIIVQAKSQGKFVGQMDLLISGSKVGLANYKIISVDKSIEPSKKLEPFILTLQKKLLNETSKFLGYSKEDLDGRKKNIRSKDTNLGILVTSAIKDAFPQAQIVLQNSGGLRIDRVIPKNQKITTGDIWELHPYGNKIVLVDLTGQQIKETLERGVYSLPVLRGTFLQVDGLSYNVDLTAQPQEITVDNKMILNPGERIIDLKINGKTIVLNKTYRVAVSDFMFYGGDGFVTLKKSKNTVFTDKYLTEILEKFIKKSSPLNIKEDGRIKVKGGLLIQ